MRPFGGQADIAGDQAVGQPLGVELAHRRGFLVGWPLSMLASEDLAVGSSTLGAQSTIDAGSPDPESFGNRRGAETIGLEPSDLGAVDLRRASLVPAVSLRFADTFELALTAQRSLELREGGQHVKERLADGRRGVHRLVCHLEGHALLAKLEDDLLEIENRATQTVKASADQRIAFADVVEQCFKLLASIAARAAGLLRPYPLAAAGGLQGFELDAEVLVRRADARVADHCHEVSPPCVSLKSKTM